MKSVWYGEPTLESLNHRGRGCMVEFLSILIHRLGPNYIVGTMPVDYRTKQPLGLLHGGANVVLAETLMSLAGNMTLNLKTHYAVGLEINANHIRSITSGHVKGIARPIHIGRSTQVWETKIFEAIEGAEDTLKEEESGKVSCISRMTLAVKSR